VKHQALTHTHRRGLLILGLYLAGGQALHNASVSGEFLIDGEFYDDPARPNAFYQCMGSVLSADCIVGGRGILRGEPFAGLSNTQRFGTELSVDEISSIGRAYRLLLVVASGYLAKIIELTFDAAGYRAP
jgi:hypothetical protein